MMLHYDFSRKQWFHSDQQSAGVTFGANNEQVPFLYPRPEKELVSFQFKQNNGNAGPIVGIMSSPGKKHAIAGNGPLFTALQNEMVKTGGLTVVFTPENLSEQGVDGYTFLPDTKRWINISTPLPHIVYNRIPFRSTEKSKVFLKSVQLLKKNHVFLFNPCFIHKFALYTVFSKDPFLKQFMPDTALIKSKQDLVQFLGNHNRIYLKPALSARGAGIFCLRILETGKTMLINRSGVEHFSGIDAFWEKAGSRLTRQDYIAQEEITPALFNGKRYDFRILAHDGPDGYKVTGVGVRRSVKQDITTHVLNGGTLLPYEVVEAKEHKELFAEIVTHAGERLSRELGYFGEFSIDAGMATSGRYVIYEVNSKPMSFDEAEIEQSRVRLLADLFIDKTKFNKG
ncbi:YheC/YheD family protein [Bacillus sp. T33-2]|uniref:YheC/YheD family protein n=1 Tax=Bacillus sp. T33-2 TaxID=2054168 RepID=UPI000C78D850|nr:YheC/YheD family protein [Bacillus sp. T33-2]PLR89936.1 hypothetical protein CVD19_22960 [Bacillus sp. T33-2]